MPFVDLPSELLVLVADHLPQNSMSSLARTNRNFYSYLNPYLYRHDSKNFGSSALLWAAKSGNKATAQISISEGAKIRVGTSTRPLSRALLTASLHGHGAVVKLLLEDGQVDVNSKDDRGSTSLSVAASCGHDMELKPFLRYNQVNVNLKDRDGAMLFFQAASHGHEAVVRLLLETGRVDVNSKDRFSSTPLSKAASSGFEPVE